jgi:hypothetical protein
MPFLKRPGPAARAPDNATSKPVALTKSIPNGKKLPTMGVNKTPPPTPANTATTPITNVTKRSINGHAHHTRLDLAVASVDAAAASEAKAGAAVASSRTKAVNVNSVEAIGILLRNIYHPSFI